MYQTFLIICKFQNTGKQGFLSRWYSNKLERRVRAGENESQHIGTGYPLKMINFAEL